MKIIKSSFLGARCVRANDPNIQLFQIRTILNMHRDALVDRMLTDLPTYIEYKFHYRASRPELAGIFDGLLQLKQRDIDLEFYEPVFRSLKRKDELKLENEYFFLELDEFIRSRLSRQLNFAA
ncbi:MAG: hypothetical protein R2820_05605 [Cyclobacteriaceae bacterium]|nr:hypothetical protein [Cyclobacteriaceae bacterium]